MKNWILSTAIVLLICSFTTTSAWATDFYVDVQNGSNAATGLSPATAWKTLTFAATATPAGPTHTIHVAPGTYSAASGEVFPLVFTGQALVGDAGSAATVLDGGGASILLRMYRSPFVYEYLSLARGLTLTNAQTGISAGVSFNVVSTSLDDVAITNMSLEGIHAGPGPGSVNGPSANLTLDRTRVSNCARGIYLETAGTILARDSVFEACTGHAMYLSARDLITATFERCRFTRNGGDGIRATHFGADAARTEVTLRDCLVAHNANGYVGNTPAFGIITANVTLTRCTVADNTGVGVSSVNLGSGTDLVTLRSTVVHGNGTDVLATSMTSAFTQIGGADPLFADRVNDDYRLRFGSPCIDVGDPSTPVGQLDLVGFPRSVDGDLDTNERADIGCLEFETLEIATSGQQGTLLQLEIFGPAGGTSSMRLGRGAFGAPVATAFGEFDLSSIANFPWVTFAVAPGPGVLFQRGIPTVPIFIGQTYSFQGLVTSVASPSGAAWSNAVSFTIVP